MVYGVAIQQQEDTLGAIQVLSRRVGYAELGSDYADRQQVERQRWRLVERLEALGVKVTIEEVAEAA